MGNSGRSFWASGPGLLIIALVAFAAVAVGAGGALIYSAAHPPRDTGTINPEDLLLRAEEVTFRAGDGVMLSGWFVAGRPGFFPIVAAHDLGSTRSSLLNTAAAVNRAGFPLLLFDFRGHGQSGGKGSSFGMEERLDVLAAVAALRERRDITKGKFGVWGVGMGAYAGVLAAAEDQEIAALALDSLYPDVPTEIDRLIQAQFPPALHRALPGIRLLYDPYFRFRIKRYSVADLVPDLGGRNILFIAAADPPGRLQEARALYERLPEGQGDKNFLELKASVVSGLYAEDKKEYDLTIVDFFSTYLRAAGGTTPRKPAIQVLER